MAISRPKMGVEIIFKQAYLGATTILVDYEAGAVFNLDYYYQFNNNLFVGVRAGAIYVLGMEGITLTPVWGMKF